MSIEDTLKLALEALQYDADYDTSVTMQKAAIYALEIALSEREALAKSHSDVKQSDSEQLGEPVAWYIREKDSATTDGCWAEKNLDICEPLYTTQQQRTAAVGEDTRRAWVRLTDEEIYEIHENSSNLLEFTKTAEAKLREKNSL